MNMCMIQDHKGNVLALDKVNDKLYRYDFPGGHVEANEIFSEIYDSGSLGRNRTYG